MSQGWVVALVLGSWPTFLFLYWLALRISPRKAMSILYDMDVVDPQRELDKRPRNRPGGPAVEDSRSDDEQTSPLPSERSERINELWLRYYNAQVDSTVKSRGPDEQ